MTETPTLTRQPVRPESMVRARQAPLRRAYRENPARARVIDHARIVSGDFDDPLHGRVTFGTRSTADLPFAVHHAVGGAHDGPVPGDLLCAALASCQESTLRLVADLFGVRLEALSVQVEAEADVRGTLGIDPEVPVAFQAFRVAVQLRAAAGTAEALLHKVCQAAERSCVVLQTLRAGVPVSVRFDLAAQASSAPGPTSTCS